MVPAITLIDSCLSLSLCHLLTVTVKSPAVDISVKLNFLKILSVICYAVTVDTVSYVPS